jgi:hypothetical protein
MEHAPLVLQGWKTSDFNIQEFTKKKKKMLLNQE